MLQYLRYLVSLHININAAVSYSDYVIAAILFAYLVRLERKVEIAFYEFSLA